MCENPSSLAVAEILRVTFEVFVSFLSSLPHSDARCELPQVTLTMSTCLKACHSDMAKVIRGCTF